MNPLSPYLVYIKLGAAAVLLAIAAGAGFHFGGLSADDKLNAYKSAVEAQHATQLQAVVRTMDEHDHQAALERIADQRVIDAYDLQKALPPITAGFVTRMRLVEAAACRAGDRVVPAAGSLAGGAQAAGGVPRSDAEGDRLLQAALDAADRDASRLNAAVKLAP
jgi:hypothetical protein